MRNSIKVFEDLTDSDKHFKAVQDCFDTLEKQLAEVDKMLADGKRWAGTAHDRCAEIQLLLKRYEKGILQVCIALNQSVSTVVKNASSFTSESTGLRKLRNW
jgi:hypothetical protein